MEALNPISDKEIIDTELQLKDLESVDKKIVHGWNVPPRVATSR